MRPLVGYARKLTLNGFGKLRRNRIGTGAAQGE